MNTDATTVDKWHCPLHGWHGFTVCAECRAAWLRAYNTIQRANWQPREARGHETRESGRVRMLRLRDDGA